jgi:hypothetical protein
MNIVTICTIDDWMSTHLTRFVHFAQKAAEEVKIHVAVPTRNEPGETIQAVRNVLEDAGLVVRFIKQQDVAGRLLYFDMLRSAALDIFGLDAALYVDPDVDILDDVSDMQSYDGDLLWVPDVLTMAQLAPQLRALEIVPPIPNCGFLHMRRSFKQDFERWVNDSRIDRGSFAPGSVIWAAIAKGDGTHALPQEYQVTTWGPEWFGRARAIHFTGPLAKRWRPYIRYTHASSDRLRRMTIEPEPVEYPHLDLDYRRYL